MYKIFIAEDDRTIANAMQRYLEAWGFDVYAVTDFGDVVSQFASFSPHLVLLDISLPHHNGYHICSRIRSMSTVPVMFITSASDKMNIIMAMNMGGDDFLAKPFDLDVLYAKVSALLRRSYDYAGQSSLAEHTGVILNMSDGTLSYNGESAELSRNELRVMQVLFENAGSTVSRNTLMTRLWETDSYIDENSLTVNVTRLRKKLELIGLDGFIVTKRGEGYMIQ